jgi:hypothetical protein
MWTCISLTLEKNEGRLFCQVYVHVEYCKTPQKKPAEKLALVKGFKAVRFEGNMRQDSLSPRGRG